MLKKRKILNLLFLQFFIIILFIGQSLFAEPIPIEGTSQNTLVVANADIENLIAQLYFNDSPLENGAIISQDSNNQELMLNNSWELNQFSIKISGSDITDYGLNINLEVGFFQLLDSNGYIIEGSGSYIIDSQTMEIENVNPVSGATFANTPEGSNSYTYSIPLTSNNYYDQQSFANFKLTWLGKDIPMPGNYKSNIQITFSIN